VGQDPQPVIFKVPETICPSGHHFHLVCWSASQSNTTKSTSIFVYYKILCDLSQLRFCTFGWNTKHITRLTYTTTMPLILVSGKISKLHFLPETIWNHYRISSDFTKSIRSFTKTIVLLRTMPRPTHTVCAGKRYVVVNTCLEIEIGVVTASRLGHGLSKPKSYSRYFLLVA